MMPQLPLRVRLTLWYALAIAVALFSIGFISLWMVHRAIDDIENHELQERVRSVSRFIESRPADDTTAQLRQEITATFESIHGNKWLQVIDEHGQWLYRSKHVAAVYPTLLLPQQAPETGTYFTYKADSIYVRALIAPIVVRGTRYTVQTGLTLNQTLAILSDLRFHLFLLISVGLVVSSLAGYFMSRKALTPIAAIAAEAQHINDKNLNSRLPTLASHDELATLSNTLNQMLERIEAGYQSVRSFTANAAHELRSPVALLRAETEVALAFPRDAAYYRDTCERILKHSMQMTHLIDQLLALARADAGVEIFQFAPVNLPDLLNEIADEWTDRFADDNIVFRREVAATDFWVNADFIALKRLLNILLENAWRYTPSGQSVALHLAIAAGIAEISVQDTGIGISAKDRERIFERFQHIARPLHGEFSGSGIGLVLAQSIAEKHHSTIRLESMLGAGSRFSLQLLECHPAPSSVTGELNQDLAEHLSDSH
jgi:heavy metal sensor kinase